MEGMRPYFAEGCRRCQRSPLLSRRVSRPLHPFAPLHCGARSRATARGQRRRRFGELQRARAAPAVVRLPLRPPLINNARRSLKGSRLQVERARGDSEFLLARAPPMAAILAMAGGSNSASCELRDARCQLLLSRRLRVELRSAAPAA